MHIAYPQQTFDASDDEVTVWGSSWCGSLRGVSFVETSLIVPCPTWLSWLGIVLQSKRSPVQFSIRAHDWVADLVLSWGVYKRHPTDVSLSLFLPPF